MKREEKGGVLHPVSLLWRPRQIASRETRGTTYTPLCGTLIRLPCYPPCYPVAVSGSLHLSTPRLRRGPVLLTRPKSAQGPVTRKMTGALTTQFTKNRLAQPTFTHPPSPHTGSQPCVQDPGDMDRRHNTVSKGYYGQVKIDGWEGHKGISPPVPAHIQCPPLVS